MRFIFNCCIIANIKTGIVNNSERFASFERKYLSGLSGFDFKVTKQIYILMNVLICCLFHNRIEIRYYLLFGIIFAMNCEKKLTGAYKEYC